MPIHPFRSSGCHVVLAWLFVSQLSVHLRMQCLPCAVQQG